MHCCCDFLPWFYAIQPEDQTLTQALPLTKGMCQIMETAALPGTSPWLGAPHEQCSDGPAKHRAVSKHQPKSHVNLGLSKTGWVDSGWLSARFPQLHLHPCSRQEKTFRDTKLQCFPKNLLQMMAAFTPHISCSSPHFPLWLFLLCFCSSYREGMN